MKTSLINPEEAAASLLDNRMPETKPVDVEGLVFQVAGLRVAREQLDAPGYLVRGGPQGGEIVIRRQDPLTRQRFTIAHELGHWLLIHKQATAIVNVEQWCDNFAAALLIPNQVVEQELGSVSAEFLAIEVIRLGKRLVVSADVVCTRLSRLLSVAFAVVRREGMKSQMIRVYPKTIAKDRMAAVEWTSRWLDEHGWSASSLQGEKLVVSFAPRSKSEWLFVVAARPGPEQRAVEGS